MPLLTPPSPRPAAPARYGLASLSTLVVLGVAVAQRDLGHVEILLLVPSAITAWYGGIGPAILASVLSTPALDYFFVPPLYSWSLPADRIPYIAVFPLFGFGIGWLTVSLRRAEESLVRARDQFEVKVQERRPARPSTTSSTTATAPARSSSAFARSSGDRLRGPRR